MIKFESRLKDLRNRIKNTPILGGIIEGAAALAEIIAYKGFDWLAPKTINNVFTDLIDIVNIVKKQIPDIKLDLIGDGSLKDFLTTKIKNLNLEENITMHGYLNHNQIEKIMLQDSLYVMTSFTESFGLVLIEAMSYGIPCVAFSSASGAVEVIDTKELLIENRDKEKMAEIIIELLNNKEKLQNYGKEYYIKCQKYLINNVKKEWLDLLNNIDNRN